MEQIVILNEQKMQAFARKLAEEVKEGDILALVGNLGTGKTTFTKYFAEALGVKEVITSPTFNIVKEYESGRLPLYHFEVYRISDPEEMFEIGYEEYFFGTGVCVVEWADLIEELLPEKTKYIYINHGKNAQSRIVKVFRREY